MLQANLAEALQQDRAPHLHAWLLQQPRSSLLITADFCWLCHSQVAPHYTARHQTHAGRAPTLGCQCTLHTTCSTGPMARGSHWLLAAGTTFLTTANKHCHGPGALTDESTTEDTVKRQMHNPGCTSCPVAAKSRGDYAKQNIQAACKRARLPQLLFERSQKLSCLPLPLLLVQTALGIPTRRK